MRSAYVTAEALVKRCLSNSHKVWNKMARWSQMSPPRQSAYTMTKSPPRRSASMSDAPLGGESASGVQCSLFRNFVLSSKCSLTDEHFTLRAPTTPRIQPAASASVGWCGLLFRGPHFCELMRCRAYRHYRPL